MSTLALRYVPFLLAMAIGLAVAYDARIRLRRPQGPRITARIQVLAGVLQAVGAVLAIVVSPRLGLFDDMQDSTATMAIATVYFAVSLVALVTLVIGLVRPAKPHPRRGFTTLALLLDAFAVATIGYSLFLRPNG